MDFVENIKQTFGVDASQAIAGIQALDASFANLQARLGAVAKTMQGFNGKAVDRLGDAFKDNLPEANRQVKSLTVSWETMTRVIVTQFIVRALSQLRNAIRGVVGEAIEFQKSLALISTIDDSGQSISQLGISVKDLSDQFNIPLLEASAGLYQTISNQVGSTADSLEFLGHAAKFARATNSSLESSVDLLSGAIKSFNLDVEDTDKVASSFFKTIDLGRLTADKLSNAFGRVGPRAAQLGLSIDEVGAALAAISVKGVNTSESITFLSGIMTGLQKPTVAMRETLRSMGFSSAELALQAKGLGGLLDDLSRATGGSAEAMAKLFPNVRGLSGAVALTSDDLKTFTNNLRETTQAGRDFNDSAFQKVIANDAEALTDAFNKLSNEMTTGLGQGLLQLGAGFLKLAGGVDNVLAVLKGDLANQALFADLKKIQEIDASALKNFEDDLKKRADAAKESDDKRLQSALTVNAALNKQYLKDSENFKSAADQKAAFARFAARTPVNERALGFLLDREITTPDQAGQALRDAFKTTDELRRRVNQAVAGEEGIADLRGQIDVMFREFDKRAEERGETAPGQTPVGRGTDPFIARVRGNIDALRADLQKLSSQATVSEEELIRVSDAFRAIAKDAREGEDPLLGRQVFDTSLNALGTIILKLNEINGVQDKIAGGRMAVPELEAFQAALQQATPSAELLHAAMEATSVSAIGIDGTLLRTNTTMQQIAQSALGTAFALREAAIDAGQINRFTGHSTDPFRKGSVNELTGHVNRMFGGYFAHGGLARGADTVPSMLSPGEMVINPKSTGKFFSQLQAMNAGKQPIFRQDGGSVTNTIGDIHVHGASQPEATADAVIRKIQRAQRRGTVR